MKTPLLLLLSLAFLGAACSKHHETHAHGAHTHTHQAPHGGTLVELGDHTYALEFVHDASAGTLTVYVLDAHAENFIRLPDRSLEITVKPADAAEPSRLTLQAVANRATGETVGDTSQFTATSDLLKTAHPLEIGLPSIAIRGRVFEEIRAPLSAR